MPINISSIYDEYFSEKPLNKSWERFEKEKTIDLSVSFDPVIVNLSFLEKIKNVAINIFIFITNIFFLPLTLTRLIVARIILIPIYPAQSKLLKFFQPHLKSSSLDKTRIKILQNLNQFGGYYYNNFSKHSNEQGTPYKGNFIAKEVVLQNKAIKYRGILVGHKDTINNGRWAIHAIGQNGVIEESIESCANIYHESQTNLLMINGPSIGQSQGTAWPETMGEAQEIGITFLERAIKAKKIALIGRSLGGSSMAQAILEHDFRWGLDRGVQYLAIDQVTFDRLSNVCTQFLKNLCPQIPVISTIFTKIAQIIGTILVKISGLEIDTIAASKKLRQLKIPEVIIQASKRSFNSNESSINEEDFEKDEMIPFDASKAHTIFKEVGVDKLTKLIGIKNLSHFDRLTAYSKTNEELKNF